jgi:hypothetical protein
MACCLFLNFAEPFDLGCCSLALEMSFVVHYLSYFRQWIILACCWPSCLSSHLFTDSSYGDYLLTPPAFSPVHFQMSHSLFCVLVFSSLFIVQFCFVLFCFLQWEVSLPRGHGWGNNTWPLGLPVWSAKCLPSKFGAGGWQWQQPTCFLSVTWHGEVFHRLGVQDVEVLILLGTLFLPSVAPMSQQGFWLTELILPASVP